MSEVLNNTEVYGLNSGDYLTDIETLNEVKINNLEYKKSKNSNAVNLPVMVNGEIELIFTISYELFGCSISLGSDFAPLLNEMQKKV